MQHNHNQKNIATDSIFSPERYAKTRLPIDEAYPLPPEVYTSQAWYDREMDTIFRKRWLQVTREEEIPNNGDYTRIDIIGEPLIVLRDNKGVVRTMSAACRHRSSELLEGSGNCKRITCPYHAWTYSLTGELIAAPAMQDAKGFDKSEHSLPNVRTELWGGFVFINFDDDAESLIDSMKGLPERFKDYKLEEMVVVRKWENRFKANWKIWVENSREGYHVRTVHKPSFDTFYPDAKLSEFNAVGVEGVYTINSSDVETGLYVPRNPTLPFIESLSEEDKDKTHFMAYYPHLLMNMPPDRITFHQYFPEGPEWTRIITWCCFPKTTVELDHFEKDFEEKYVPAMLMFIGEDKGICEVVHRGIVGRLANPCRFSPQEEKTVHEFSNYVLDHVLGPVNE